MRLHEWHPGTVYNVNLLKGSFAVKRVASRNGIRLLKGSFWVKRVASRTGIHLLKDSFVVQLLVHDGYTSFGGYVCGYSKQLCEAQAYK